MGLKIGALNIIASRISAHAYACLLTSINQLASVGLKAAFISFSYGTKDMQSDLLSNRMGIHPKQLKKGQVLDHNGLVQLHRARKKIAKISLSALHNTNFDALQKLILEEIESGAKIFFMDALQYVAAGKIDRRYAASAEDIFTANCQRLADLIKSKGITIIALALLNEPEVGKDAVVRSQTTPPKWPVLADIRDGRILEQLAYQIIFLHHPGNTDHTASLIVAKSGTNLDIGACETKYYPQTGIFK